MSTKLTSSTKLELRQRSYLRQQSPPLRQQSYLCQRSSSSVNEATFVILAARPSVILATPSSMPDRPSMISSLASCDHRGRRHIGHVCKWPTSNPTRPHGTPPLHTSWGVCLPPRPCPMYIFIPHTRGSLSFVVPLPLSLTAPLSGLPPCPPIHSMGRKARATAARGERATVARERGRGRGVSRQGRHKVREGTGTRGHT